MPCCLCLNVLKQLRFRYKSGCCWQPTSLHVWFVFSTCVIYYFQGNMIFYTGEYQIVAHFVFSTNTTSRQMFQMLFFAVKYKNKFTQKHIYSRTKETVRYRNWNVFGTNSDTCMKFSRSFLHTHANDFKSIPCKYKKMTAVTANSFWFQISYCHPHEVP